MSHNRISIVCLVLLALTASVFIATQLSTGQIPQTDKPPLKMKVLRNKAHVRSSPGPWEIAVFKKTLPQKDERKLEDLIPKHVPIKIKIKKEKEAGFKDLNNEKWAREFELEVTNTGTKPIYAVDLYVVTDIKAAAGFRIVFQLYYGRTELGDIRTKAEPTDVPIQPNESVSLKIHSGQLDAWDYARRNENRPFPKHLKVNFQFLSFGDGTGYIGTDASPLPSATPEQEGTVACFPFLQTDTIDWKDSPPGSQLSKLLAFNLPVATGPVNFFRASDSENDVLTSPLFQTCCEGVNCSRLTRSRDVTCVNCPVQDRVGTALCSNPDASCLIANFDEIECFTEKGQPYSCQTVQLISCSTSPTPSPSPLPSPSPSPSPSPTPTPCPLTLASHCPGGVPRDPCTNPDPPPPPGSTANPNPEGCPFGYQVSGLCCVPIACPQPTPTAPSCPEGQTSIFSGPPVCQWGDCFTLLPEPDPTATSTPVEHKRECVDYYWVWFVSYDGGRTWHATGQMEYAGCLYLY